MNQLGWILLGVVAVVGAVIYLRPKPAPAPSPDKGVFGTIDEILQGATSTVGGLGNFIGAIKSNFGEGRDTSSAQTIQAWSSEA